MITYQVLCLHRTEKKGSIFSSRIEKLLDLTLMNLKEACIFLSPSAIDLKAHLVLSLIQKLDKVAAL